LNGKVVRSIDSNYHYKEIIELFCNFTKENAQARLAAQHYYPGMTEAELSKPSRNSKVFELYGRLNLLPINKLLLPGVSFTLNLTFESQEFYLMENVSASAKPSKLKFENASLLVKHVTPIPAIRLAHEKGLMSGKRAIYEMKKGDVFIQSIPTGTLNLQINNFYTGVAPSLMIFGLVKSSSYHGTRKENPFVFNHYNLNQFSFIYDGAMRPANGYNFNISETHSCYMQLFSRIYENLGHHNSDRAVGITTENFTTDHFFIVEDCSKFNVALSDISEPLETVTIGVSGSFKAATTHTLMAMLYVLVPSRFEIDKNRTVEVVI
jgi:hypothetical protein